MESQTIKLTGVGNERELQVEETAKLFYTIHEEPSSQLKIVLGQEEISSFFITGP